MNINTMYNIIYQGDIHAGFDMPDVERNFATLVKISEAKSATVLMVPCRLKKGVTYDEACAYKNKLEQIGLRIQLQVDKGSEQLAPLDAKLTGERVHPMVCPKCQFEQVYAEKCQQCGVYINNAHSALISPPKTDNPPAQTVVQADLSKIENSTINIKALLGIGFAAVVGALLWYFVAVTFDYELGLLAWGIGGMVGYAAVMLGGRGEMCAIMCGGFALLSIVGGKYLAVQGWQYQIKQEILATYQGDDMRPIYDREMENAKRFKTAVVDDNSQREFIVANGYVVVQDTSELTQEDIDFFNRVTAPRLDKMAAGKYSFNDWGYALYRQAAEGLSVSEVVGYSFGWVDFIFIFLGVGTAYQLGRGASFRPQT